MVVALRSLRRVEARLEEGEQVAGDPRVRGERRLDEALRQRKADLPQVLRVRSQDDDVGRARMRRDDQAVEFVVLDFATEDAPERVFEHGRALGHLRRAAATGCRNRRSQTSGCPGGDT
jgi:hypothetical protein